MQFSAVVKQKLNKRKLKITDLAKQTGYSTQYISDLIAGKRRWNETVIDKVSQVLGIKISFTDASSQDGVNPLVNESA